MKTLIENYINGNLSNCRRQAKRFSHRVIRDALQEILGYSLNKSALVADWMKTGQGFQESCDAK